MTRRSARFTTSNANDPWCALSRPAHIPVGEPAGDRDDRFGEIVDRIGVALDEWAVIVRGAPIAERSDQIGETPPWLDTDQYQPVENVRAPTVFG